MIKKMVVAYFKVVPWHLSGKQGKPWNPQLW